MLKNLHQNAFDRCYVDHERASGDRCRLRLTSLATTNASIKTFYEYEASQSRYAMVWGVCILGVTFAVLLSVLADAKLVEQAIP